MFSHDRIIWNNLSVSQETPRFSHAGLLPGLPFLGAGLPSQSGEQRMGTQLFPPTDLGRSGQIWADLGRCQKPSEDDQFSFNMFQHVSTLIILSGVSLESFETVGSQGWNFPCSEAVWIHTETRQLVLSKDQFICKQEGLKKKIAAGLDLDILRLFGVNFVSP